MCCLRVRLTCLRRGAALHLLTVNTHSALCQYINQLIYAYVHHVSIFVCDHHCLMTRLCTCLSEQQRMSRGSGLNLGSGGA